MFTEKELKAIKDAVSVAIDINEDMLLDDLPYGSNDIRKLAAKSNNEIKEELSNIRRDLYKKIEQYIVLRSVKQKLDNE